MPRHVRIGGAWVTISGGATHAPGDFSLKHHLDAQEITGLVNTDPVASWDDLSIADNDAVQATAGLRPLYSTSAFGGRPSVMFDGSDDALVAPAPATTVVDNFTMGVVCDPITLGDGRIPYYNGVASTNGYGIVPSTGGGTGLLRGGIAFTAGPVASISVPQILLMVRTAGVWTIRRNGVQIYSGSPGAPTAPATSVRVGNGYGPDPWNGYLAEAFVLDEALDLTEMAALEAGLASKWGFLATPSYTFP